MRAKKTRASLGLFFVLLTQQDRSQTAEKSLRSFRYGMPPLLSLRFFGRQFAAPPALVLRHVFTALVRHRALYAGQRPEKVQLRWYSASGRRTTTPPHISRAGARLSGIILIGSLTAQTPRKRPLIICCRWPGWMSRRKQLHKKGRRKASLFFREPPSGGLYVSSILYI